MKLWDLAPEGVPKLSAADHLVHKREFIDWAKNKWGGDATHLVEALKRYGNRDKKPSQTQLNAMAQETANRAAFDRVVEKKGIDVAREFSYSELLSEMQRHFEDLSQDLYSLTSLKNHRNKWLRESQ